MKSLIAALALVSSLSFGAVEVAPKIVNLSVTNVETVGKVLRETNVRPYTNYLISIPAEVSTGSVCVSFVGIERTELSSGKANFRLTAKGATNPLTEACIEIFPMPVKTDIVVEFNVLTGGFVPASRIQQQVVEIAGHGQYLITLDMATDKVTVTPVK